MGQTLNEMIDDLPKSRRDRIDQRYRALKDKVERLKEPRAVSGSKKPAPRRRVARPPAPRKRTVASG